jgi:hypothetical protein
MDLFRKARKSMPLLLLLNAVVDFTSFSNRWKKVARCHCYATISNEVFDLRIFEHDR